MSYLSPYRDAERVAQIATELRTLCTRPWTLMEVCGGQTHSLLRNGILQLLPPAVRLIHGPGCPVCVTPVSFIDQALALARRPDVTLASFGDMLRVPGSESDLLSARAEGAQVEVVYSPLDALKLASEHPDREVVFFGVGFETTAPSTALAVLQAQALGLRNFSLLVAHVLVPPALEGILQHPERTVQGFLAAGHVCTVMGFEAYRPIAERYHVPIAITGFEPVDLMEGIQAVVADLEAGRFGVTNLYPRAAREGGNPEAIRAIERVFEVTDRPWRGLGELPASGLKLRSEFAAFDAAVKFPAPHPFTEPTTECRAGEVLMGLLRPPQCPAFGKGCRPERPLGAPMVSSEGACAAYYRFTPKEASP